MQNNFGQQSQKRADFRDATERLKSVIGWLLFLDKKWTVCLTDDTLHDTHSDIWTKPDGGYEGTDYKSKELHPVEQVDNTGWCVMIPG